MPFLSTKEIVRTERLAGKHLSFQTLHIFLKIGRIKQFIDIILCISVMLLIASRLVLVRRLTPDDSASCNKNRVWDRYESCQMFSDLDGLLCTAAKGRTKNRLCMLPCCFTFLTDVTKNMW
jgi:hypothetical protein